MATAAITPDQDVVTAEIFIAAPPERVFQAITDPSQSLKWWGERGMYRVTEWNSDLRPGGKWSSLGMSAVHLPRGRRISGGRSPSSAGLLMDSELVRLAEDRGALGARAARGPWLTTSWAAKGWDGHRGENSSLGICRYCSKGVGQSRTRLDPRTRLDTGICRERRNCGYAQGSLGVMIFAWMGFPVSGFQFCRMPRKLETENATRPI